MEYNQKKFITFKQKIIEDKKSNTRSELIAEIFKKTKNTAAKYELDFLKILEESYLKYGPLKFKTLNNLDQGKKEALNWCLLN